MKTNYDDYGRHRPEKIGSATRPDTFTTLIEGYGNTVDALWFDPGCRTGGVQYTVKQLIPGTFDNQSLAQGLPPWQL